MDKHIQSDLTILFVEDDKIIREEFSEILNRMFKKVFTSNNGYEALKIFNKNHNEIDLIISDLNMPIMNGVEFLEKIRENNIQLPFIFTTAQTDQEYIKKALSLHINDYLIKPIKLADLKNRVSEIFNNKIVQLQND